MDTEALADRRRMFELFTAIKVSPRPAPLPAAVHAPPAAACRRRPQERSLALREPALATTLEEAIEHWTAMAAAGDAHALRVVAAVRDLTDRSAALIHQLYGAVRHLDLPR